jgi:gliding motility-associated-like protein
MILAKKHSIYLLLVLLVPLSGLAQTYFIKDAAFRQCLTDLNPSLINGNNELNTNAAANFTGELNCSDYGATNVDGLQFFTNVKRISLTKNKLSSLEEISGLTQLEDLSVNDNEITQLPDLSNFNNLKAINAHNNYLSQPPTLPEHSQLFHLNLSQNYLTSFPDLSNQVKINHVNISRNTNILAIPTLPELPNLNELSCYLCGLSEVPNTSNLPNLSILNIGYNKLKTLPDFSANQQLTTIYANDNQLESFADMGIFPKLEKVRLYNNYLSFEDFIPLLENPNYDEIYKIVPQKTFPNPLYIKNFEYDSISLKTGIDNQVSNVNYSWFRNGDLMWSGNKDTLSFPRASKNQSGEYYFTLNHPDFPDLTITSEIKSIKINECINVARINSEIIGATCEKAGIIKISSGIQPQNTISYILESKSTNIQQSSTNGYFTNLNNPEYRLYVKASERCIKLVDDNIILPIEECKEAYFSPNNDGVDDRFYFTQHGKAKIYNKWGQLIQELSIPTEWDGRLKDNSIIQSGYYTIEINNGEKKFNLTVVY